MNKKTTSKILVTLLLVIAATTSVSAQVVQKIGSNPFKIDPKAVFELESKTKGFLPPRMTTAEQASMGPSLPEGLIVYITDGSLAGLQIWKSLKWITVADAAVLALKADTTALDAEVNRATAAEAAAIAAASTDATTKATAAQAAAITAASSDATTKATAAQAAAITAAASDATTKATAAEAAAIAAASIDATAKATAAQVAATAAASTDATDKVLIETNRAIAAEVKLTTDKENTANKSTDVFTDKASDVKFPSVKAVKTYVDVYSTFNAISTITSSYTATISDYTILCNNNGGTFTLTLPTATSVSGKIYVIRKTDESSNLLTISPALKLTESTAITSLDYPKTIRVQSDGTSWYIID